MVAGDPFPRVIWTKVNESGLSTLPKFILGDKNQTLTITNVTLKDHGNYTCTTSNKYQTVKKHVIVYVEGKSKVSVRFFFLITLSGLTKRGGSWIGGLCPSNFIELINIIQNIIGCLESVSGELTFKI